jgi:Na+/serine symporter
MGAVTNVRHHPLFLLLAVVAGFAVARLATAAGWGAAGVSVGSLLLIAGMIGLFAIVDARHPAARSRQR